jgi:4a-hydroxytetrahydrobiopterin dehydratase
MSGGWVERPDVLERDFGFEDFRGALAFVNRVADLAEEANHTPDILIHGWNKVRLSLTSHDRGGVVTGKDHDLARRIDEVVEGEKG